MCGTVQRCVQGVFIVKIRETYIQLVIVYDSLVKNQTRDPGVVKTVFLSCSGPGVGDRSVSTTLFCRESYACRVCTTPWWVDLPCMTMTGARTVHRGTKSTCSRARFSSFAHCTLHRHKSRVLILSEIWPYIKYLYTRTRWFAKILHWIFFYNSGKLDVVFHLASQQPCCSSCRAVFWLVLARQSEFSSSLGSSCQSRHI